jgi:hypothetical protein
MEQAKFDPNKLAVLYYFGDLRYSQIPAISADALEHGFDGRALRRLVGLVMPVASDICPEEIDSAFREMRVAAPIPKDKARLALATEAARRAISGESNLFNEARASEYISANATTRHRSCSPSSLFQRSLITHHAGNGSNSKTTYVLRCPIS